MIFGKTFKESKRARWWFAWRPVVLDDGRIAWLQYVWRYWSGPAFFHYIERPDPEVIYDENNGPTRRASA